ncbi:hypothetical protein HOY80DRAFT_72244 [Tuber brumale]|nr:hypothetical protein HOY80DRAFT_72244 [Tuber brumale]
MTFVLFPLSSPLLLSLLISSGHISWFPVFFLSTLLISLFLFTTFLISTISFSILLIYTSHLSALHSSLRTFHSILRTLPASIYLAWCL